MPELPEVETTRRGIEPYVSGKKIKDTIIRQASLRWPIPASLPSKLLNTKIDNLERRGKYIIFHAKTGQMILHLGMSGSLRITSKNTPPRKHDHVDFMLENNKILRFHDPRRFGCILWNEDDIDQHFLLKSLGPEPLTDKFDGQHLFNKSRKRKVAVKNFIMNSQVVVGVGNIYASEALFSAGIRPSKAAGSVSLVNYKKLCTAIKRILNKSIKQGGTTLKDFANEDGNPGYFAQKLNVYGRDGDACKKCKSVIKSIVIGQRSSFYCPTCQA